jgi:hypothetical protein
MVSSSASVAATVVGVAVVVVVVVGVSSRVAKRCRTTTTGEPPQHGLAKLVELRITNPLEQGEVNRNGTNNKWNRIIAVLKYKSNDSMAGFVLHTKWEYGVDIYVCAEDVRSVMCVQRREFLPPIHHGRKDAGIPEPPSPDDALDVRFEKEYGMFGLMMCILAIFDWSFRKRSSLFVETLGFEKKYIYKYRMFRFLYRIL